MLLAKINLEDLCRMAVMLICGIVAVGIVVTLAGCRSMMGMDSPETVFTINPLTKTMSYRNSKDMSVEMEDVEIDPASKKMSLGRLSITSDASTVRNANVGQMQQAVAWQAQVGANFSAILARLESIAGTIAPGGIKGLAQERMDPFYYVALGVAAGLYLWIQRRREAPRIPVKPPD
jgi:uncharacterized protein (UPF0254 family)